MSLTEITGRTIFEVEISESHALLKIRLISGSISIVSVVMTGVEINRRTLSHENHTRAARDYEYNVLWETKMDWHRF